MFITMFIYFHYICFDFQCGKANMIQPDSSFKSSRQIGQDLNEDYMRRQIVKTFHFDPERINPPNEKTGEQF